MLHLRARGAGIPTSCPHLPASSSKCAHLASPGVWLSLSHKLLSVRRGLGAQCGPLRHTEQISRTEIWACSRTPSAQAPMRVSSTPNRKPMASFLLQELRRTGDLKAVIASAIVVTISLICQKRRWHRQRHVTSPIKSCLTPHIHRHHRSMQQTLSLRAIVCSASTCGIA